MREKIKKLLKVYFYSCCPIIYIYHSDFSDVDYALREIWEKRSDMQVLEFNNALGALNFKDKHPMDPIGEPESLAEFLSLNMDEGFKEDSKNHEPVLVLKDVHESMHDTKVIALLRRIAEFSLERDDYRAKVIIVASKVVIPPELENFVTLLDVPLPDDEEIRECIRTYAKVNKIKVEGKIMASLALSLKGLNRLQIQQVLSTAYQNERDGKLSTTSLEIVRGEKEQIIRKSDVLEMVECKDKIEDIGGLENLKVWLKYKAAIFKRWDEATKFGVDVPKGVLILGMPGCGKSLAAKATATLFEVPLIRLDMGHLMGKYVGESEENMRRALQLAETVSPCVLWIDELEKAFAGIGGEGDGGVSSRLFGHFLTWMQEREGRVFIVATANDISKLPPEFLRKGRFDELFFVDFPNEKERQEIFKIHLEKRRKLNEDINVEELAVLVKNEDYFSGADIEGIVNDAVETAFIDKIKGNEGVVTFDLLKGKINDVEKAKSTSKLQKKKIQNLRERLKSYAFKPASSSVEKDGAEKEWNDYAISPEHFTEHFIKVFGKHDGQELHNLLELIDATNSMDKNDKDDIEKFLGDLMKYASTIAALRAVKGD